MTAARAYLKAFLVVPAILLFNVNEIFSSERTGISPAVILSHKVFSPLTREDVTLFVLTIGNLYFFFLCNFIYGTWLFHDANSCGTYVFSRMRDRRAWFYDKVKTMLLFSFCYMALTVLFLAGVSLWQSRAWPDVQLFAVAGRMIFFFTLLAALTNIAISLLALRLGSAPAFFAVYFLEALMVLSLLIPAESVLAKVWGWLNPFGGIFSLDELGGKTLFQMVYVPGLFAGLIYLGGRYIAEMDIGLADAEAE